MRTAGVLVSGRVRSSAQTFQWRAAKSSRRSCRLVGEGVDCSGGGEARGRKWGLDSRVALASQW